MAEAGDLKWAQEAYASLALFRRVQNRLSGLLFMQIGWAALLVLVAQFTGKDKTPAINVAGIDALQDVKLSALYPIGVLLVLLWWLVASHTVRLLKLFTLRLLRTPASLLLGLSWYLLLLMTLPYFIIAVLVQRWRFNRWKARQDRKWLAEYEPRLKDSGLREIYEKDAKWRLDKPYDLAINWLIRKRQNIVSTATIALAPFYSYSFEEEQRSAKAPMQIFATAITRLRQALADLPTVPYMRFVTIPDIVRIESDDHARIVVRRYGIDTLLWGSYLSAAPPRIWLNIQSRPNPGEKQSEASARDPKHPLLPRRVGDAMMIVDQNDTVEAYIVITLSYLRTLAWRAAGWNSPQKSWFWRVYDRLSLSFDDRKQVFLRLIIRLLSGIPEPLPDASLDKTPRELLVEHASSWVVEQMRERSSLDQVDDEVLCGVLRHCIRLKPSIADHHYRLGVMLCLMDNEEAALAAMTRGQVLDIQSEQFDRQWISSMAESFLTLTYGRDKAEKAKTVAYVARGLALGGNESRARLLNVLSTDQSLGAWRLGQEHPSIWDTADRLLNRLVHGDAPQA
jgi:hypothetical protein